MSDELPALAITGATGHIGGGVARQLANAGVPLRLLSRSEPPALKDAVGFRVDYSDRATAVAALTGVDTLLLVSAAESETRVDDHRTMIDAAAEAGVSHVVYTSFLGAAEDAVFTLGRDHHATEKHIERSGLGWTFLRDNLYADFLPHLAGPDGVIRGPAGDGRVSAVARDDVVRVAATVLRKPAEHRDVAYDLTGPKAISLEDAAEILTSAGKPTRFENETLEEAFASRASFGAPDWQVEAWVSTYTAIASGELAVISDDVERITGKRGLSLGELLAQEA